MARPLGELRGAAIVDTKNIALTESAAVGNVWSLVDFPRFVFAPSSGVVVPC
jgi:hypothetical protein